ncbi:VC0807 family protein [Rugosimonospora africana]|uniref:VC0807 family protein n=1 Tax=Rugosimonospora africana TaxID=556532 RepID=UPI001940D9F5|nr:VC0807 family protein [Rugosimonospora africana]
MSTTTESQLRRTRGIIGVLPYLLDIVVPLVSYYVLTSVGLSPFWSLLTGGALTTVVSIVNTIRRGKIDNLGILVIVEIALGLVLDLAVRDPRLTLARGSLFIALAGVWILVNTFTGRPITVDATKPFAAKKGGTDGIVAFEWLARNSPRFLRIHRSLSTVWSVMFLAYAAVRVVVIYRVTISEAVWLTEVPGVIAIAVCLIASARAGKQLEALVTDRMEHLPDESA